MPTLEVFADIGCPFAHVGLRLARQRRDQLGLSREWMWVRSWPLELVNGKPQDPDKVLLHIADLKEQVEPGLFAHFDPTAFPTTTLPALTLAAQAYREDLGLGEVTSFALRDALFEEGRDISRRDVLTDIAQRVGMPDVVADDDHQMVLDEWEEGRRRGVEGSPHFFCKGMDSFCPSMDISRAGHGHTRIRLDRSRLDGFLAACFVAT